MGKETEIDLTISDESDFSLLGKSDDFSVVNDPEDKIKSVLDERDYIPPIEDAGEQAAAEPGDNLVMTDDSASAVDATLPADKLDVAAEAAKTGPEIEILLADDSQQTADADPTGNAEEDLPGGTLKAYDEDTFEEQTGNDANAPANAGPLDEKEPADELIEADLASETETLPGANPTDLKLKPDGNPSGLRSDSETRDWVGFDGEEEKRQDAAGEPLPETKPAQAKTKPAESTSVAVDAKKSAASGAADEPLAEKQTGKKAATRKPEASGAGERIQRWALVSKISSMTVVVLIGVGIWLYLNPSLIGLSKPQQTVTPPPSETPPKIEPIEQPLNVSSAPGKREQCEAKLAQAVALRNQLLEKKNEIYELDLYYRSRNSELEKELLQEIDRSGPASFKAAVENKHIELSLRTIQRRQAYIEELKKPAHWLDSGSEELYYLIRRAELDLQLTEVAGGIDLRRHMRHISAAIQKYRPAPDKLAIDPMQTELKPLERIWEQIGQTKTAAVTKGVNPQDEIIANQICNGNYERIAELTRITTGTATCLARMKGPDLFLNGVTTLSADAAKRLFQWRGNWICLNGLKDLSQTAAQYLFRWKGNWISLNSLAAFPPELAQHLLKWEGQQLELMGLKHSGGKTDKKMLKYLALWETTGGKLFVPEKIRQELKQLK
jgi:hypothetical protein